MIPEQLRELHERKCEAMRGAKEVTAAAGEEVMNTILYGMRDYDEVLVCQAMPDRDTQIEAMSFLMSGFGCTQIAMVYETFHTTEQINPLSGEPWELGEMQYVADHYPESKEWLTDSLTVTTVDDEGHVLATSYPFSQEDRQVTWDEGLVMSWTSEDEMDDGFQARTVGALIAGIRAVQELKSPRPELLAVMNKADPEMARRIIDKLDCALVVQMTRKFEGRAQVGLLAPPGSERAELIKRSFSPEEITVVGPEDDIEVPSTEPAQQ